MSEQDEMGRTPGPWMVWQLGPSSDPGERCIVTTADGETEVCGVVPNEADAPLIAAAPDLLKALQGVLRVADRKTVEFDAARAAIAAATNGAE